MGISDRGHLNTTLNEAKARSFGGGSLQAEGPASTNRCTWDRFRISELQEEALWLEHGADGGMSGKEPRLERWTAAGSCRPCGPR